MDLASRFEACDDGFLRFQDMTNPLHQRADLCAFLLLDRLVPSTEDILGAAEHDQVFLNVNCDMLNEAATDEDIMNLARCGVFYDGEGDSLAMYV